MVSHFSTVVRHKKGTRDGVSHGKSLNNHGSSVCASFSTECRSVGSRVTPTVSIMQIITPRTSGCMDLQLLLLIRLLREVAIVE